MGLSGRQFTREFQLTAVGQLEQGVWIGAVARALEVNPNVLHRWRREFCQGWRCRAMAGHESPRSCAGAAGRGTPNGCTA